MFSYEPLPYIITLQLRCLFLVFSKKNDKEPERGYHINKIIFGGHYFVGGNGPVE